MTFRKHLVLVGKQGDHNYRQHGVEDLAQGVDEIRLHCDLVEVFNLLWRLHLIFFGIQTLGVQEVFSGGKTF